jgi:hypothetical protein
MIDSDTDMEFIPIHDDQVDEILDTLDGRRYTIVMFVKGDVSVVKAKTPIRNYHYDKYHLYKYVYDPGDMKEFYLVCKNKDTRLDISRQFVAMPHYVHCESDPNTNDIFSEIVSMKTSEMCPDCFKLIKENPTKYGIMDMCKNFSQSTSDIMLYLSVRFDINNSMWYGE